MSKKILFVGEYGSGKRNLALRLSNKPFPQEKQYSWKSDDNQFTEDDLSVSMHQVPSGRAGPFHMLSHSLRRLNPDGIIITFSLVEPDALQSAERFLTRLVSCKNTVPFILVGTKKDLREDKDTLEALQDKGKSAISFEEGLKFAMEKGANAYREVSALTSEGLNEVRDAVLDIAKMPKIEKIVEPSEKVSVTPEAKRQKVFAEVVAPVVAPQIIEA